MDVEEIHAHEQRRLQTSESHRSRDQLGDQHTSAQHRPRPGALRGANLSGEAVDLGSVLFGLDGLNCGFLRNPKTEQKSVLKTSTWTSWLSGVSSSPIMRAELGIGGRSSGDRFSTAFAGTPGISAIHLPSLERSSLQHSSPPPHRRACVRGDVVDGWLPGDWCPRPLVRTSVRC